MSRHLHNRNVDTRDRWAREEEQSGKRSVAAVAEPAKSGGQVSAPSAASSPSVDPLPSAHTPRTFPPAFFRRFLSSPSSSLDHEPEPAESIIGTSSYSEGTMSISTRDEPGVRAAMAVVEVETQLQHFHRASLGHMVEESALLPMITFPEYNFD